MKNQHIILLVVALGLAPLAGLPDAEPLKPETKNVKGVTVDWNSWTAADSAPRIDRPAGGAYNFQRKHSG